jgi:hypothetical protein
LLSIGVPLKPTSELLQGAAKYTTEFAEFEHVKPTLARLVLAHERLGLSSFFAKSAWRQPGFDADLSKKLEKSVASSRLCYRHHGEERNSA